MKYHVVIYENCNRIFNEIMWYDYSIEQIKQEMDGYIAEKSGANGELKYEIKEI